MRQVVVVGELNVDFILHNYQAFPVPGREVLVDDFRTVLGSASAICAVGLARLGVPVAFIGRVGCDVWGDFCIDALCGEGVDVSGITCDGELKTGVTVSISSTAERALVTYPGLDRIAHARAPRGSHVHRVTATCTSPPTICRRDCGPAAASCSSAPRPRAGRRRWIRDAIRTIAGTKICARRCARSTCSFPTTSS